MTTYTIAGRTTERDTGNGSRGTGTPGGSTLAVIDADGKIVADYERREARWGGGSSFCWFLTEDGRRQGYHQVPSSSDAKTLRQFFKTECAARYGVKFGR